MQILIISTSLLNYTARFFIAEKDDPTGENDYLRIIEALLASEDDISKFFLVATQQAIKEAAWPVVVGSTMNVDIVVSLLVPSSRK